MSRRAFTNEQADEVRELLDAGASTKSLAERYGVSTTTIKNVRRNLYIASDQARKTGPKARPIAERLWDKIEKRGEDQCWPWRGASRNGQGTPTTSENGVNFIAYRKLFELTYRPLAEGESVLHTCRNARCMNPGHLYAGDKDSWAKQLQGGDLSVSEVEQRRLEAARRSRQRYREKSDLIRKQAADYQLERKLAAVQYKGGMCQECGEDHPAALQFHHRDPEEKAFSVNAKTLCSPKKISWREMKAEIEKCDLLCGNCHARLHSSWTPDAIQRKRLTLEAYGIAEIYEGSV